jgi:hypothetical protein
MLLNAVMPAEEALVPPEATGSAVARVRDARCVIASTTFVPLLNTNIDFPAGTTTPVPEVFLTVLAAVVVLFTKYNFSIWQPDPRIKLPT